MTIECPKCQFENPDETAFCSKCETKIDADIGPTKTLEIPTEKLIRGSVFAGRYEVIEELGKGGMGKVYRVVDTKIKEEVALKLIKPEIATDKKTIERFNNELKYARKIRHKNVCQMFDLGEEKGTHYITMEYIPGEDLKSMIKMSGQISVGVAVKITKQVAEGLTEAHRLGIVHRDLKPSNVMIDKEGNAHIMDFGIARSHDAHGVTELGMMIGTPEYMSPEQVDGEEVDQRSDIYSLGVMLFEMITGQVPFRGKTPISIAMKHKSEAPQAPRKLNSQIPEDLSCMVLKCMEKERGKRYQNDEEVLSQLNKIEIKIPTKERALKQATSTFQSFFDTLKERKIFAALASFTASGMFIYGIVHWIFVEHYHLPDELLDITIITVLCALICTLIWLFFGGKEKKARKIKAELILIAGVILISVFLNTSFILQMKGHESEPVSERIIPVHNQLTFNGSSYWPAISSEGQFIAYVYYEDGEETKTKLMVQDIDSGQARDILVSQNKLYNLTWLPNSNELSFTGILDIGGGGYVISSLGGMPRKLDLNGRTSWSPDGSQYAIPNVVSKETYIFHKSTGYSQTISLSGAYTWIDDIDWSPLGNLILLRTRDSKFYTLWTITIDGKKQNKVLEDSSPIISPRWAPRGDAIYYLYGGTTTKELRKIQISPDTGKPSKPEVSVLTGLQAENIISIANDGKKLVYDRMFTYSNLWLASVKGSGKEQTVNTVQLTTGTFIHTEGVISPDGTLIAFSRGESEKSNIFIISTQGGSPSQLTFFQNSSNMAPVWSPDSKEIAFSSNEGGSAEIWKVSIDGGAPYHFKETELSETNMIYWAPGQNILYHIPGNRNFYLLDPTTEEKKSLVEDDSVGWMFHPTYSPDLKEIAVEWNRPPDSCLWIISIEDASQRLLLKASGYVPLEWSFDGRWIYVYNRISQDYFGINSTNGQIRALEKIDITLGNQSWILIPEIWNPDVNNVFERYSDIWMVENYDPDIK